MDDRLTVCHFETGVARKHVLITGEAVLVLRLDTWLLWRSVTRCAVRAVSTVVARLRRRVCPPVFADSVVCRSAAIRAQLHAIHRHVRRNKAVAAPKLPRVRAEHAFNLRLRTLLQRRQTAPATALAVRVANVPRVTRPCGKHTIEPIETLCRRTGEQVGDRDVAHSVSLYLPARNPASRSAADHAPRHPE